mmetsp:Transcript_7166/g.12046  ORF Transcript_7166/g.12046 Transcript_7166/m.12046 type:complete len:243 (-) Transcript_7166:257-985(-)
MVVARNLLAIATFSVVKSSPLGAASARRFLLLHGTGSSAGAFVNSPTASGAKNFLSGVPCRTDASSTLIPPNWQYTALDAESTDGSWWKDGSFSGADASISSVESAIQQQGAAGIIGHEQGGTLAAIVAARSALGEGVPLKFAIICGAAMPIAGPYAELLYRLRDSPSTSIPTLHCIGKSDGTNTEQAEELAACFAPSAEVLWHTGGRAMPDRSWWEQTEGYPERVTGGNRWVTQLGSPRWY